MTTAHLMLVRLAEQLGKDLSEFTDFDFDPRMGEDNALIFCDRRGNIKPTPLYEELAQRIGDEKRDLLILDNIRHLICRHQRKRQRGSDRSMVAPAPR